MTTMKREHEHTKKTNVKSIKVERIKLTDVPQMLDGFR